MKYYYLIVLKSPILKRKTCKCYGKPLFRRELLYHILQMKQNQDGVTRMRGKIFGLNFRNRKFKTSKQKQPCLHELTWETPASFNFARIWLRTWAYSWSCNWCDNEQSASGKSCKQHKFLIWHSSKIKRSKYNSSWASCYLCNFRKIFNVPTLQFSHLLHDNIAEEPS